MRGASLGSRPSINEPKKRRRRRATALRDVRRRDGRNAQTPAIRRRLVERAKSDPERPFAVSPMNRHLHPIADVAERDTRARTAVRDAPLSD
jgi:hypothetical protein